MAMITVTSKIEAEPNKISALRTELKGFTWPDGTVQYRVEVTAVVDGVALYDTVEFGDEGDAATEWCDIIKDDVNRAKA